MFCCHFKVLIIGVLYSKWYTEALINKLNALKATSSSQVRGNALSF